MNDTEQTLCDQCDQRKPSSEVHKEWVDPVDGANGPVPVTVCRACDKWGRSMSDTERDEAFYAKHYGPDRGWEVHRLNVCISVPTKGGSLDESLQLLREILDDAAFDIGVTELAAHDAQVRTDERERVAEAIENQFLDVTFVSDQFSNGYWRAVADAARIARSGGAS